MPRNTATAADLRRDDIAIESIAQAIDSIADRLATHLHTVCTAEAERPAEDDAVRARRYLNELHAQLNGMQHSMHTQIRVRVNITTTHGRRFHGRPLGELQRDPHTSGIAFWPAEPDRPRGKPPTVLHVQSVELHSITLHVD